MGTTDEPRAVFPSVKNGMHLACSNTVGLSRANEAAEAVGCDKPMGAKNGIRTMFDGTKTILMVDDEKPFLLSAKEGIEFCSDQLRVLTAENGRVAQHLLESKQVDLVITDLKMPVMDGFELMAHISQYHREVPTLVMTAFGTPEIQLQAKNLGAKHYMEKPIGINDLLDKIIDALSNRTKSRIHGFCLANFLQLVEIEEKTLVLKVLSKKQVGHLYINAGVLVDAETETRNGKEAAIEIINWDDTEIEIIDGVCRKQGSINASLMQILLEATRYKDEQAYRAGTDDPVSRAMLLAEGFHYGDAQKILSAHLKGNSRDHIAWIWYSRVIGSMRLIENAVKNAHIVAPDENIVVEEIKKFRFAQNQLGQGRYPRCPYCWIPVDEKARQCHYCRGHFYVDLEGFQKPGPTNRRNFYEVAKRYIRVIEHEKNARANFYLGMTYFNLQEWEQALDFIHRAVKSDPQKPFYSDQLNSLLGIMAAAGMDTAVPEKTAPDPSSPTVVSENGTEAKTVLVVEDSSTTRKVITITLRQQGFDVVEAKDGVEALDRLSDLRPDLILLDIILPKIDGYRVLSVVKENPELKKIPVIMLTSRDGLLNKVKGRMAGSTAYLTKPFEPRKLVETIEKVLEQN
jgi:twitching motility two-component system response regulator PilG